MSQREKPELGDVQRVELPAYDSGIRRCPKCGSRQFELMSVPPQLVIVFRSRCCAACGHAWTPRPPRVLAVLYGAFGVACCLTGLGALGLIPLVVIESLRDKQPVNVVQVTFVGLLVLGGPVCAMMGRSCVYAAKHIWFDTR